MNDSSKDWQSALFDKLMDNFVSGMAKNRLREGRASAHDLELIAKHEAGESREQKIATARSGIRLVAVDGVIVGQ